jgi:hypothetical protein
VARPFSLARPDQRLVSVGASQSGQRRILHSALWSNRAAQLMFEVGL